MSPLGGMQNEVADTEGVESVKRAADGVPMVEA
jgi:hypothetical protein